MKSLLLEQFWRDLVKSLKCIQTYVFGPIEKITILCCALSLGLRACKIQTYCLVIVQVTQHIFFANSTNMSSKSYQLQTKTKVTVFVLESEIVFNLESTKSASGTILLII